MLLVLNWKMNPETHTDAIKLLSVTKKIASKNPALSMVVAPPTVFLGDIIKKRGSLGVSAQHTHDEEGGAHTGDVSVPQVVDVGSTHVLIGHAERRAAGMSNEQVGKVTHRVLSSGVTAIVCVGEGARDDHGEYLNQVRAQLHAALQGVLPKYLKKVVIAYEPVWAIGASQPMSPHEMHQMAIYIKKTLAEMYGKAVSVPVLYGGAITADSVSEMVVRGGVDGLLVGRASLSEDSLAPLCAQLYL
jgi:triosephosphate isomerase